MKIEAPESKKQINFELKKSIYETDETLKIQRRGAVAFDNIVNTIIQRRCVVLGNERKT